MELALETARLQYDEALVDFSVIQLEADRRIIGISPAPPGTF